MVTLQPQTQVVTMTMRHPLPDDKLLTEREAAELLALSPRTLRNWRCEGRAEPRFTRLHGAVRYPLSGLREFISQNSSGSPSAA